jgi:hypothetical protein
MRHSEAYWGLHALEMQAPRLAELARLAGVLRGVVQGRTVLLFQAILRRRRSEYVRIAASTPTTASKNSPVFDCDLGVS